MQHREIHRIASDAPFRPFRVLAPVVAVTLSFCAICAYVLIEARHTAWDRAGDAAASLAAAIESDLAGNIETLDLSLQAVIDNLKHPEIGQLSPGLRRLVLFDRAATARRLEAVLVLDEVGNIRIDSRSEQPPPVNLADRDYFQVHRESDTAGLYISRPHAARVTGQYFIGVSKRLSHRDGSFAGVVVGAVRLSHIKQMFKDVSPDADGNITLSRSDGIVLMRWPYSESYVGRDLSHAEITRQFVKSRSGRFETVSATDGVPRLVVYSQIGDFPMIIGVGQSIERIYGQWRRFAWTVALFALMLCAMSAALAWFFLRELRRHRAAEKRMAALATTDGLTGLSNRWHFDETIRREWRRSRRDKAPLALLMIDTDLFKAYNDAHGHQAGDQLLKLIGEAILSSIRRSADLGARYGGDEFAVLLPGTSLDGAAAIADQIRSELTVRGLEENVDVTGISIGAASLVAEGSTGFAALLKAADSALYRAKSGGRNRTERAESAPARAVAPDTRQAA